MSGESVRQAARATVGRLRHLGVVLVGAVLLLAAAGDTFAASRRDIVAGSRALKARAASLRPLATADASPITRDAGAIAVIEYDGVEPYDANLPDGTPNYAPRASVAQTFYQTHGDFYDFLLVFTNFEFDTTIGGGKAIAFHNYVRNSVEGINLPVGDNGALFGSPSRLLGYIDMAAVTRYTTAPLSARSGVPLSASPGDEGFRDTLNVVAHEIGHQWLAHARFRDTAGQVSTDLLGADGAHWNYLLDSDGSLLYGADWVPRGNGTYQADRVLSAYSPLDLYLMGFLDSSKVPPFTLLRNPSVHLSRPVQEGEIVSATPETISIEQVLAAEGARSPGHAAAQKTFRVGFIFLTSPGVEPAPEDLEAVETIRQAFVTHFFALTRGVALAETSFAAESASEAAPAPDMPKALAWLLSQQAPDGQFEDSSATTIRDTVATLDALLATNQGGGPRDRARLWLKGAAPASFDFLARRAAGLGLGSLTASDRTSLARTTLARQNADGGFGPGPGYASDPLDTALALRSLAALNHRADAAVFQSIARLATLRVAGGGWPAVPDSVEVSTVATAHVLLALQDWGHLAEAQALVPGGLAALLSRRNPDLGFGESPSTAYATALALQVLVRAGATQELLDGAIAWLNTNQLTDGSWEGSVYATALVLTAVHGAAPNLIVASDSVAFDPPSPEEGAIVRVSARIRNVGQRTSAACVARLFDGDPERTTPVAEAAVPALDAGGYADVVFQLDTTDRAGTRALYIVADAAREVPEAREDDNVVARALTVTGLLPDLLILPSDLRVEPYPPEAGETVQISAVVRNAGERRSMPCSLRFLRGDPRQDGVQLGSLVVPALEPAGAVTLALPWDTTGQQGDHDIYADVDALSAVYESDELNNVTSVPVRVTGPGAGGIDLEVTQAGVVPGALETLPQSVEVRALVRNLGRERAIATVALFEGQPASGAPVASQPVNLAGRASTSIVFPLTVASSGDRFYTVQADPEGLVPETDETNNQGAAALFDPRNTLDVEARSEDVTLSPDSPVIGDVLQVTAIVRNRGTAPLFDLPVILGHNDAGGVRELLRQAVSLDPGMSTSLTFAWQTSIQGDAVPLVVQADPFDLLAEVAEANNSAAFTVRVRPSSLANVAVSGTDVVFAPDPPLEGADAVVSVVVRNDSAVDAGAFVVRFYRGDPDQGGTPIGEASLAGLAAGASAPATATWSPVDARGAQGLFVVADALGQVEEYDETDNRAFRPFAVTGLPDVVLTTGDTMLDPGYPRAGEVVTIRATVRNLGQQVAGGAILRAYEGPGTPGTPRGDVTIPALAPGQSATLEIDWTPASPAGERLLTLIADADDAVREQDEGNNLARRTVLVQNADLYLTEPFFSPNGDGVKDQTTLGYRATSEVTVVVSNNRGQKVRTLAESSPASGSVTWDGRDGEGHILWDGRYTFTVEGEGGRALARIEAVLDTNRSPIHDAAGTGMVAEQGLTCFLPSDGWSGPEWMPSDAEALFIVRSTDEGFVPGLLRVDRGGNYSYIAQGDWWQADYWSDLALGAVSPDGQYALVRKEYQLYVISLRDGTPQPLNHYGYWAESWSPDGRWILAGGDILSLDGEVVSTLPESTRWSWSPDGEFLVAGDSSYHDGEDGPANTVGIFRRDGSEHKIISLPKRYPCIWYAEWKADGAIYVATGGVGEGGCYEGDGDLDSYIVDPESGSVRLVDLHGEVSWSPDGAKALFGVRDLDTWETTTEVSLEDGSASRFLWPEPVSTSPWGSVATVTRYDEPGTPCNKGQWSRSVVYTVNNLQNLIADLNVVRLPANNGLLVRGTVADAYLDHYQLDYAVRGATDTWYPIGPSFNVPVLDDVLTVWVPQDVGTYVLRLRAFDLAGNSRTLTRVVAWDRRSSIANVTFDEALFSPGDDGIKDDVTFRYLVLEPTRVDVRIAGPERDEVETIPTVRRFTFEHSVFGPASFVWNGRDEGGRAVLDGRYTVYINDLPFRIEVDATPPDIGIAYENLRAEPGRIYPCPEDEKQWFDTGDPAVDKRWHVVDEHLKGMLPVYEPEQDASGRIVYDDGVPRPERIDGRIVGRVDPVKPLESLVFEPLTAEDYAGNRSTMTPLALPPQLLILDVGETEHCVGCPKATAVAPQFKDEKHVYGLLPETRCLRFSLFATVDGQARFEYRPEDVDPPLPEDVWLKGPDFDARAGTVAWSAPFDALTIEPGRTYRSRFILRSAAGETLSEEFWFGVPSIHFECEEFDKYCNKYLKLCLKPLG